MASPEHIDANNSCFSEFQDDDGATDNINVDYDEEENPHPPNDHEIDSSSSYSSTSSLSSSNVMIDFTSQPTVFHSPTEAILRLMVNYHTPPGVLALLLPRRPNSYYPIIQVASAKGQIYTPHLHDKRTTTQKQPEKNDPKIDCKQSNPMRPKMKSKMKQSQITTKDKKHSGKRVNKIYVTSKQQNISEKQENNKIIKCGCKSSNCIKLYCKCFQVGSVCNSNCKCVNCFNTKKEKKKRNSRTRTVVMQENLKKEPDACS